MKTKTRQDLEDEAQQYIDNHLSSCIKEIVHWYDTGLLLTPGYVRHVADLLVTGGITTELYALMTARTMVEQTTMRKALAYLELLGE